MTCYRKYWCNSKCPPIPKYRSEQKKLLASWKPLKNREWSMYSSGAGRGSGSRYQNFTDLTWKTARIFTVAMYVTYYSGLCKVIFSEPDERLRSRRHLRLGCCRSRHWEGQGTAVLRIRIRDPMPFWPLDPGSGMGSKSASGSGIRDEQPGSYFLELVRYRLFLSRNYCLGYFNF